MPDASRSTEDQNPVKDRRGAGSVSDSLVWACRRCKRSPQSSPGRTMFVDVSAEIPSKIFQRTLKGFDCPRRKGAERVAWSKKFRLENQRVQITSAPTALLHCKENLLRPRQPAPTRRTPAARFLRKELFEIPDHSDRARLVVQHNHGSRAQPASRVLHVSVVHRRGPMLPYQEDGPRPAPPRP